MEIAFLKSAFRENNYPPPDKPEIAFAGKSNVGKSSLINVLVNRKGIARTSSKPGRTQAINFFCLEDRLYLVDLPGYGFARVPLHIKKSWGEMVETYLRKRSNLMAVVVILDIRRELSAGDKDLLEWLQYYGKKSIVVLTKADKLSRQKSMARAKQIGNQLQEISSEKPTLFSAKTREGRGEIWEKIDRAIEI
ncbi:MAG: YihA family ribosome biogenesis GTP-binding protein [Desulfobacteraceae bacterium]|nr:YihA family ribosome biogenesis GTP-binding protein [Desulfobacteraceae bacterium]